MKTRILEHTDAGFLGKSEQIVNIYNKYSKAPFNEVLNLPKPQSIKLVIVEGIRGGVLFDRVKTPDGDIYSVMYAAFMKRDQKKGHLSACIRHMRETGLSVKIVELGYTDGAFNAFNKLGFTKLGMLNLSQVLTTECLDFIKYKKLIKKPFVLYK
ncbi:hypothetical protein [Photobacterium profundum]|uniref:N-acetyltransferase domain-containing protein n=1 Tax=Photobacterium profundum (strain SS9) TaxID=298386 RepID=Q6LTS3_PHOPR|nr:hypothetical protein [Photobacterium profundum]CAG19302.1 hypothetical protein PBPRA0890 [Photobacterium profundum SS9]